ncbi:MAG: glycine/betaine/sarcosine/D-proline family reductase selenoprotein B, partial [Chloroflexi bacterium]|nr:glycine/betaine/sarcosine/D-proline family reductase selenoprotein B [Chloroflexota bacterium]
MTKLRVVHYLNQFFAGIGGEEKADTPPQVSDGPLGPANALDNALAAGDEGRVVATVLCGDNYLAEHQAQAHDQNVAMV